MNDGAPALERQADDLCADGQACPELVGLNNGALRQLGSGDAGREAQIVLDAHAAAGLTPGPGPLQHHRVQALRGAVNRRGEARWPRADHDKIVHDRLQRPAESQCLRELPVRGVTQEQLVAPGDHGRVGFAHPETLEELSHLRFSLGVQPGERNPVLGQKVAHAKRVLRIPRADDAQAHELCRLPQDLPPGDERLEDDVAQARMIIQEMSQSVRGYLVDYGIATSDGLDDRWAAGQLRHVACELTGPEDHDSPWRLTGFVHDLDRARLDDEETEVPVADIEELFPIRVALERRQRASIQCGHLGQIEHGECETSQVVFAHVSRPSRSVILPQRRYTVNSLGTVSSA